jgi:hypothetical protein
MSSIARCLCFAAIIMMQTVLGPAATQAPRGKEIIHRYGKIRISDGSAAVTVENGTVRVTISKRDGLAMYSWNGAVKIRGASSSVQLDRLLSSTEYPRHLFSANEVAPLADGFGMGVRVAIRNEAPDRPALRQSYYVYEDKPYFFVEARVESHDPVSTNWIAPLVVETPGGVDIGSYTDVQALFVPWDNDHFIRFHADPINSTGTSYEAGAFYDNASRNGIVLGSVTHDTWKTGIEHRGANNRLDLLKVYGGASSKVTQDNMPHGRVSGTTVISPRIFVGYYTDWRNGMEEYAAANSVLAPPIPWKHEIPLGWNSWAAYGCGIQPKTMMAVSDFMKNQMETAGYTSPGGLYINWDAACGAGPLAFGEEYATVARHIKANKQHPGIYFSTFAVWQWATRNPDAAVTGTDGKYTWNEIFLRDADDQPIVLDGGHAIDPTHPGTKMYVEHVLNLFKRWGYEYVKLDFLSHGAVEGKHYLRDMTAMQAYNYGMRYIRDTIGDSMFISLSIAPLFPGAEYAQARRISCDAFGAMKDTAYMLNAVTYGWWLGKYYRYNDGDHVVVASHSYNEGRSRATASAIAGLFLDSDKLAENADAQARAKDLLTRPGIVEVARKGRTFQPLESSLGDQAANVFALRDGSIWYLAVFNYTPEKAVHTVDLSRAGMDPQRTYFVKDLWDGTEKKAIETLTVELEGQQATILRLTMARSTNPTSAVRGSARTF